MKEIEKLRQAKTFLLVFLAFSFIGMVIIGTVLQVKIDYLEEQNEDFKKRIPVWTLKLHCEDEQIGNAKYPTYLEMNITDYEEYSWWIENINYDNCEVLK